MLVTILDLLAKAIIAKENPSDGMELCWPGIKTHPPQPIHFACSRRSLGKGEEPLACQHKRNLAHLSNLFLPCFEGRLGGVGLPLDEFDEMGDSFLDIV